jgi:diguanylate cyclase (GGDEF)-like protein
LPQPEIDAIRTASLLYDIGELAIPEHIITKPGQLTPEEFEKVKTHPEVGAQILESVHFPYPVTPIVQSHHERWDGTGYPQGIRGTKIPIGARILAAADALDALSSPRHHRDALPVHEAFRQVEAGSGSAYDPSVIALIRKRYRHWERIVQAQKDGAFVEPIFSAQREANAIFNLLDALGNSLDLDATFFALRNGVRSLMDFQTLIVWLEQEGQLQGIHCAGDHLALCSGLRVELGTGFSGRAAAEQRKLVNGFALPDFARRLDSSSAHVAGCPFAFGLSVPLDAHGTRGALTLYRTDAVMFSEEDVRLLSLIAPKLSTAIANGLRYRRASDQAQTDSLTGLPNASALYDRLRAPARACAVVVCDLDGFKKVNDRFGHLCGNRVLRELASAFRLSCRGADFIARLGGDEFVLVLEGIGRGQIGLRLAQFREIVRLTGHHVCGEDVLGASFGAAFFPEDGRDSDALLAIADRNMYRGKREQDLAEVAQPAVC